jgi:hypothetical protein
MRVFLPAILIVLGSTSALLAQVTVQQPAIESFGVSTSVSVPDRGRIFMGGVNSAASSRQSNGPLRTGTSRGYSLSASSTSVGVTIIDIRAMDEAILNSVPDSPALPVVRSHAAAANGDVVRTADPTATVEKIVRFEKLAQQAEMAGKVGVAKLHWQMAAKHGSSLARAKLNPARPADATTAQN